MRFINMRLSFPFLFISIFMHNDLAFRLKEAIFFPEKVVSTFPFFRLVRFF